MSFVGTVTFGSFVDRDRYWEIRFGPLIRATELLQKLWGEPDGGMNRGS